MLTTLIGLIISLAAAVVPTFFYALAFYLADRYEREPVWMGIVAFLWGAIPAVVTSLFGELVIGIPFVGDPGSLTAAIVESALVAPFVEEIAKGAALFAIYKFMRNEFDGVLDGITYGALIGFGFAMTENFFYFIGAFSEGGFVDLTVLIFLRAVIFGLNHALYTGLFGIGLGLARHAHSPRAARFWIVAGFAAAVAAHALHNLGASISSVNSLGIVLSLGLAVGGVALIGIAVLLTWRQEHGWLRDELRDEVGVLLSQAEYDSLVGGWRRSPLLDARRNKAQARRLQQAVEIAFRKHRLRRLGAGREPKLAGQIDELRGEILGI
ncbi:MAG: PrsW family intramembrane metalloprotease [Chloroflexi bacterium]|nr:PrsW family intramembrane metalloprotease [Chloroflexota bacterium]